MPAPQEVEFDLNKYLAEQFMGWQSVYLRDAREDECRLYCAAFMEGAKAVQLVLQQAVIEVLQEAVKQ
jgi:hypothetical protein